MSAPAKLHVNRGLFSPQDFCAIDEDAALIYMKKNYGNSVVMIVKYFAMKDVSFSGEKRPDKKYAIEIPWFLCMNRILYGDDATTDEN